MSVAYTFGLVLLVTLGFQSWISPLLVGIVALALCGLAALHEANGLPAEIQGFRLIMDILDRLTDKQKFLQAIAKVTPQVKRDLDRTKIINYMRANIFGHDDVIEDIVRQICVGYKAHKRETPIGVFMLAGPSATGKTKFGEVLGTALFGEQGSYTVDLATFSSAGSASAITGAAPGYMGSDQSSALITHLRAFPYSVVVVDEFEKADRAVQRQFLRAWNDGVMTDQTNQGTVSTKNVVFVVTTNAMEDAIAELADSFTGSREELSDRCKVLLRTQIEPSLLSRINYVFPFSPLQGPDLGMLLAKLIEQTLDRFGLTPVAGGISYTALTQYYTEAVQRGVDPRSMRDKISRDISEQAADLQGIDAGLVVVFERDGQVFVEPYREPATKAPPKAKAR